MKIKMITIHNIPNFGSVFQAIALSEYLSKCGHQCEVIDYNPTYFTKGSLRTRIGKLLNFKSYWLRTQKYRNFVKANMNLSSSSYSSNDELRGTQEGADIYLAGGDQLWNEFYDCGQDDAYKLKFTDGRKAAFGTSLGKNEFTSDGLLNLADSVSCFEGIGIREQSGVKLLRQAGIRQVCHVCDPIFLLSKEDYKKYINPVPIQEKYVFVYLVQASELLNETVEYISRILNLKVVLHSGFSSKCRYDKKVKDLGPDETLSYLVNASYVISASFHATAFSVLFHKPFVTLLPGINTSARISDFLTLLGLENRIVTDIRLAKNLIEKPIEWDRIDQILKDHINKSEKFLLDILKGSTVWEGEQ